MFFGSCRKAPNAESTASLRVCVPIVTGTTFAPKIFILLTFGASRSMSIAPMWISHSSPTTAAAVASATPCCPAPVSAKSFVLPIFFARIASPMQWLILCAPV